MEVSAFSESFLFIHCGVTKRYQVKCLSDQSMSEICPIITPPQNRGGVIFSLQFVCVVCLCVRVCVCVCVCPVLLVNKIPAERMNRFEGGFH